MESNAENSNHKLLVKKIKKRKEIKRKPKQKQNTEVNNIVPLFISVTDREEEKTYIYHTLRTNNMKPTDCTVKIQDISITCS